MSGPIPSLGDSADALYAVDHYQRIVMWNDAAHHLLGRSATEVLNCYCHDVIAGCGRDGKRVCGANCEVRTAVENGELPAGKEMCVTARDGGRLWVHLAVIVVPSQPAPLKLHVLRDISAGTRAVAVIEEVESLCRSRRNPAGWMGPEEHLAVAQMGSSRAAAGLTPREREVVRLLGSGLSNSAMAAVLAVSVHTVRNHMHHILAKFGAHTRAEVVSLMLRGSR